MNAHPRLNKAYIMIGTVAILMLAMLLGSIAVRKRLIARGKENGNVPSAQQNSAGGRGGGAPTNSQPLKP